MFVTFYQSQLLTDVAVPCVIYLFVCLFVCLFAVLWCVFAILITLQGLFIFLAFTFTKKVRHGLHAQLGLQRDQQMHVV